MPGMNAGNQTLEETPKRPIEWKVWVCLAVASATLVMFRLHALDLPLETDECNYAYIGARLLEGESLYVDVWDHQPFGVFVMFAGVIALFGHDPIVFRLLALAFSLVSLWLIFAMLRRSFDLPTAVTGALLFAVSSSDPGTAGEGCNREIYMNTAVLAAWYLASLRPIAPRLSLLGVGIALALGSAIKTILAIHWLLLAVYLAVVVWVRQPPGVRTRKTIETLVLLALGPIALWAGALAYFWVTGRAGEFVDAVFLFNLSYAGGGEGGLSRLVEFFAPQRHPFIFDSALPLWIGGLVATVWLALRCLRFGESRRASDISKPATVTRREGTILIVFMVAASFLAVCTPGRFWPHYYYLLIPPLALACAAGARELAEFAGNRETVCAGAPIVVSAILLILLCLTEYREYLSQPPFGITIERYNSRDFWGKAMGEKVKEVTQPQDSVFVFGSDTGTYYYSDRRCASRYTMVTGVSSAFAGADSRRKILLGELREHKPRVILILLDEKPFEGWLKFLEEFYEPIGLDHHDRTGEIILYVYGLKDHPVKTIDWNWDRSQVGGWLQ